MQREALTAASVAHRVVGDATLFDLLFLDLDVRKYRGTQEADVMRDALKNRVLRKNGVLKAPGKLFAPLALNGADLEATQTAMNAAVTEIA